MPSLAIPALGFAIAALVLNRSVAHAASSPILMLLSRACLTVSVILAPWLLKGIIVGTVLVMPSCLRWQSTEHTHCSRLCVARANCPFVQT